MLAYKLYPLHNHCFILSYSRNFQVFGVFWNCKTRWRDESCRDYIGLGVELLKCLYHLWEVPLRIWTERKKVVNKFKIFFWLSAIISKIQASKLPTCSSWVPGSYAQWTVWKKAKLNSRVYSPGGWDSGTVRCLKDYIFKTIALNQKIILNLLTNFLRSFQINKGPTSDIGTLSKQGLN